MLETFLKILFIWEREPKQGRGREREREREREKQNPKQGEPDTGLKLTNSEIMIWAKIKSQNLNQMSHPVAPEISETLWVERL